MIDHVSVIFSVEMAFHSWIIDLKKCQSSTHDYHQISPGSNTRHIQSHS